MTTAELLPLLQRVEKLGGPLDVASPVRVGIGIVFALDMPGGDSRHYRMSWDQAVGEYAAAAIIHALLLDAEARGWVIETHRDREGYWVVWLWINDSDGYDVGGHTLLEATLRAWIKAREAEA